MLADLPGLLEARVDLAHERAAVTFDNRVTDLGAVQSAIIELGYGASPAGVLSGP